MTPNRTHRASIVARFLLAAGSLVLPAFASAQSLDGMWQSQGYGYVYKIRGSTLEAFEVTTRTCVPGFHAKRSAITAPDREATFKSEGDLFFIRAGGSNDHKLLHNDGSASDIRIDRLAHLPAVCDHLTADTPLDNFDVFTQTWAEHYISFDLKQTDWDKVVAENRAKITSQTTPRELLDVLAAMIKPFGDAHTGIQARKLQRDFQGLRPDTREISRKERDKLLATTDRAYLQERPRKFCNGQIQYGHIDNTTGYLRILSFSGYSNVKGDFAMGLIALESALDAIFSDPALQALVIDVRLNGGGDDPYGLVIASRLAAAEYLAYTKQARADPVAHDKWTPGDPSVVRPSSRPGFRGPAVELIGRLSISAAETFTQALMGRTPHITRIGENTQGVFSDVLERHLPNRWTFGVPNEVFRTPQGTTFDGPGIPPDIPVPVFAPADIAAGKDPALEQAMRVLLKAPRAAPTSPTSDPAP